MRTISLYDNLQELGQYEIDSWPDGHIVTIGRSELTMWSFPELMELSSHHLSIRKLGDELYIRDEASSNGTTIEDKALTHPVRMRADVCYLAANRLSIYLEGTPASDPCEDIDCSSVFPEEYAFALTQSAPPPLPEPIEEEPILSLEPEPVEEEPILSLEPEPVEEEAAFSLEPEPVEDAPPLSLEPEPVEEVPSAIAVPTAKPTVSKIAKGCVLPFLPIAGAPKGGIPRDFELEVRIYDEQHHIPVGGQLILQVFASERCSLLIFCREQSGSNAMIYPNKQQISQSIPAGQWTLIPDPANPHFEFIIEGPAGVDEIQVIARALSTSRIQKTSASKSNAKQKAPSRWSHASLSINVFE